MTTVIEVFADVLCPFTHVGIRRLTDRRDQLRSDAIVLVKAWPLELVNDEPVAAEVVAEEVDALRAQVAPDLFGAFDRTQFPGTSLPALGLAAAAYQRDARVGEQVSLSLRDALFEHGLDIADPGVLTDIGRAHDVRREPGDDTTVIAQWHEGQARGVVGSPYFFANGEGVFCPSMEIKRIDGRLQIASDPDALEHFLASALSGESQR